jgi:hypothetical protein
MGMQQRKRMHALWTSNLCHQRCTYSVSSAMSEIQQMHNSFSNSTKGRPKTGVFRAFHADVQAGTTGGIPTITTCIFTYPIQKSVQREDLTDVESGESKKIAVFVCNSTETFLKGVQHSPCNLLGYTKCL